MMRGSWIERFISLLPERIVLGEAMRKHTTFAIGGPADAWVCPHTAKEAAAVLQFAQKEQVPLTVLGGGSNVLVKDGGIRGIVMQLTELRDTLVCSGGQVVASAGYMMKDICCFAAEHELSGLEFAVGIPGTLGGAVFMNAGAYDGEISPLVKKVIAAAKDGSIREYQKEELHFSYRHSVFQETGDIILEVHMELTPGSRKDIEDKMADLTVRRESKQPLEHYSAGSTFKRPQGYFAGTLIDQTGLKGLSIGDAQVSEKHAGFVINRGTASAKEVLSLIEKIQDRVYEAHHVHLEPEVKIIGED